MSILPFIYGIYSQEVLGKPWGDHPGSTVSLIFVLVFDSTLMTGIILLIAKMKLIVEVRQDSIRYRYPPIIRKWRVISKAEVWNYKVRKYNPVAEYGGWGIKLNWNRRNKAYNVKGNVGLQLYLRNGKKLLIGTQRKQAIKFAMDKMMEGERG